MPRVIDGAESRRRHRQSHALNPDAKVAGEGEVGRAAIDSAVERGDEGQSNECLTREAGNPAIWLSTGLVEARFSCGVPRWYGKSHQTHWESGECRFDWL